MNSLSLVLSLPRVFSLPGRWIFHFQIDIVKMTNNFFPCVQVLEYNCLRPWENEQFSMEFYSTPVVQFLWPRSSFSLTKTYYSLWTPLVSNWKNGQRLCHMLCGNSMILGARWQGSDSALNELFWFKKAIFPVGSSSSLR